MGTKKERRSFSKEFKEKVVLLIIEERRSIQDVAQAFDIHPNVIHRWNREYLLYKNNAFPGKGHLRNTGEEMSRLQRELESVKEERDILKKALAILSNRSK